MTEHSREPLQPGAQSILDGVLAEHRAALSQLDAKHTAALGNLAADILAAWRSGGKLLICGNGGSAADSQHLAAELVGRYEGDRPGWPAVALTTDTSLLTAVSNDFGFAHVFARQIEALGRKGDVLLVISTSGNSPNCIQAVQTARARGLRCHGLLGRDGGALASLVDGALVVPAAATPRIQELHVVLIHALCAMLEANFPTAGSRDW
jgi:D-sedoheptulose 7-phosphate isomerase